MGMFDNIICHYNLPGIPPAWIREGHPFQSKDLDCQMDTYTIAADGSFDEADYTGNLVFYTSNVVGAGPGLYTQNGEDAEDVEYTAKIVDGKLVSITETGRSSTPAFPVSKQIFAMNGVSAVARQTPKAALAVGTRLYVLWGGQEVGYWVEVVHIGSRHICVVCTSKVDFHHAGNLELLDPRLRDHSFWDSEDEALGTRKQRKDSWDARRKEYEDFVAQRMKG